MNIIYILAETTDPNSTESSNPTDGSTTPETTENPNPPTFCKL